MISRRKGDTVEARKLLEEAVKVAPGSRMAREAYGDELVERQRFEDAKRQFEIALLISPHDVNLERKQAECVYRISMASLPPGLLNTSDFEGPASGKIAVILSVLLPGLGQIVSGATALGAAILGGWLLAWFFVFLVPHGIEGLLGLFAGNAGRPFNSVVLIPLGIGGVIHAAAIADASARAKSIPNKTIMRPQPPVDKPFEL